MRKLFLSAMFLPLLSGCASPAQRLDERANEYGYQRLVVAGEGFQHLAYFKAGQAANGVLHVYLDGDGTPWLHQGVAAADPTPRNPLMLTLMSLDPAPSIYLGRPCYHGLNKSHACSSEIWTDGRYSEAVVASMSAALNYFSTDYQALLLLGYSGGGTLAMLLAERQVKTAEVVTVAANLDTEGWSALHHQRPLTSSLNPAKRPALASHIRQIHYAGMDDDNVPPQLVHDAIARQFAARFKAMPNQDHSCCWRDVWPEILESLADNRWDLKR